MHKIKTDGGGMLDIQNNMGFYRRYFGYEKQSDITHLIGRPQQRISSYENMTMLPRGQIINNILRTFRYITFEELFNVDKLTVFLVPDVLTQLEKIREEYKESFGRLDSCFEAVQTIGNVIIEIFLDEYIKEKGNDKHIEDMVLDTFKNIKSGVDGFAIYGEYVSEGINLSLYRRKLGITQEKIAEKLNKSVAAVSNIEVNEPKLNTKDIRLILEYIRHLTYDELFKTNRFSICISRKNKKKILEYIRENEYFYSGFKITEYEKIWFTVMAAIKTYFLKDDKDESLFTYKLMEALEEKLEF